MNDLLKDAQAISKIISDTQTEYRGNLFVEISECLNKNTQYFTASLLKLIGNTYGVIK